MTTPLTLLLVDGHPGVRQALSGRLQRHPDVANVLATDRLPAAMELARRFMPDVVICDPRTLGSDVQSGIRQLTDAGLPVIVLTSSLERDERAAFEHAGAADVLLKGVSIPTLIASIERACAGPAIGQASAVVRQ